MFSIAGIDLLEQELLDHERTLLEILLQDKTTKKNIIWATDPPKELQTVMYEPITLNWANHTASKKKSCRNWLQANRTA